MLLWARPVESVVAGRPSPKLNETGADTVFAPPRLGSDDRALPGLQAEIPSCSQRQPRRGGQPPVPEGTSGQPSRADRYDTGVFVWVANRHRTYAVRGPETAVGEVRHWISLVKSPSLKDCSLRTRTVPGSIPVSTPVENSPNRRSKIPQPLRGGG